MARPKAQRLHRNPLYRQVAALLREEVLAKSKPGDCLASENHLARQYAVSAPTMREALGLLAQEGLLERRHGSGTYVRERATPARHVAVLLTQDISQPRISYFGRRVFQQVRLLVEAGGAPCRGYVGFRPAGSMEPTGICREFDEDVAADRISAVVCVIGAPSPEQVEVLAGRGVPLVGHHPALRVGHDHAGMVRLAVKHLVGQGRRRIGLLESGDPHHSASEHPVRDLFRKELSSHGLAFREEWYRGDLHACWPGAGWEEFREIWQTEEKPDALFIADDVLAQDVALALVEMGLRVPRDLEVVAHANQGSEVRFPFSVALVENDPDAHAKALVEMTLALLGDPRAKVSAPTLSYRLIPAVAHPHPDASGADAAAPSDTALISSQASTPAQRSLP